MIYFYLLDANQFQKRIEPALAACWRERSFEPSRELCVELAEVARGFLGGFAGNPEPLVFLAAGKLPFDPNLWECLAGEILIYSSTEMPEIQVDINLLFTLMAPAARPWNLLPREQFAPIHQVILGATPLRLGGKTYLPRQVGYNDREDVVRLNTYLQDINPNAWQVTDLQAAFPELSREDVAEELDFAREWFPALRDMYQCAHNNNQIVICERLEE